jgi:hypothetical protein
VYLPFLKKPHFFLKIYLTNNKALMYEVTAPGIVLSSTAATIDLSPAVWIFSVADRFYSTGQAFDPYQSMNL